MASSRTLQSYVEGGRDCSDSCRCNDIAESPNLFLVEVTDGLVVRTGVSVT